MFSKLLDAWRTRRDIKRLEAHPVHGPVLTYLRETLNDRSQGIGKHWSEDGKQKLIADVLRDLDGQLTDANPAQAVRMRLVELMFATAGFDVLIMQPPTPFAGISGELKQHIPQLRKANKELEEFFFDLEGDFDSVDSMFDAVLARYWVLHLFMSSLNIARLALGDYHTDRKKDWFRPCYISFCIWRESNFRHDLGMPLPTEDPMAELKVIMHSTWMQRAEEGHSSLRLVWERSWTDAFDEPSPYEGSAVEW